MIFVHKNLVIGRYNPDRKRCKINQTRIHGILAVHMEVCIFLIKKKKSLLSWFKSSFYLGLADIIIPLALAIEVVLSLIPVFVIIIMTKRHLKNILR